MTNDTKEAPREIYANVLEGFPTIASTTPMTDWDVRYVRADTVEGEAVVCKLVPVEPTEAMIIEGFESCPHPLFSSPKEWGAYEAMSGCQQAAHRARLCYAAMLAAAPAPRSNEQTAREDREAFERANGGELDRLPDGCYRKWSVENDFKLWTAALEYARKK